MRIQILLLLVVFTLSPVIAAQKNQPTKVYVNCKEDLHQEMQAQYAKYDDAWRSGDTGAEARERTLLMHVLRKDCDAGLGIDPSYIQETITALGFVVLAPSSLVWGIIYATAALLYGIGFWCATTGKRLMDIMRDAAIAVDTMLT